MGRYVISFDNGLYYHDVQSSTDTAIRMTDNIKNAHYFSDYKDAEKAILYWGMHNDVAFNLVGV